MKRIVVFCIIITLFSGVMGLSLKAAVQPEEQRQTFCTVEGCTRTGEHQHYCDKADCTIAVAHQHVACSVADCTNTDCHEHDEVYWVYYYEQCETDDQEYDEAYWAYCYEYCQTDDHESHGHSTQDEAAVHYNCGVSGCNIEGEHQHHEEKGHHSSGHGGHH